MQDNNKILQENNGFKKLLHPNLSNFTNKHHLWTQFRNSFLTPRFLFPLVIRDQDYDDILNNNSKTSVRWLINRFMSKIFWFWPRIIDAAVWADSSDTAHYDPSYYLEFDSCAKLLVDNVDAYASGYDARILDLGCNIGRHLHALHSRGYNNLVGVDAMPAALQRFKDEFSIVAASCELHHDLFQRFLSKQTGRSLDILFTRGATIELVHPSFNIVKHMCDVTRGHVVLVIHETNQKFSCFYTQEFARHGFVLVKALRPVSQTLESDVNNPASLLVYQRGDLVL